MRGREPLPAPGRNFSTVRQAKTRRGGLAKPRCRAYAVCGARRAAPRQCPALRARGSQRILNQPDAAVLRVRHVKQRAVWRKVQTERAMKAAGYPARARPPCAAHGKRVACRGADDADLVVACVRDSHLSRERTHACGPPEGARVPSSVPALGRPLLAFSGSAPASVAVRRFCPDGNSAAGADASEHPARGGCVWTCSPRIALMQVLGLRGPKKMKTRGLIF